MPVNINQTWSHWWTIKSNCVSFAYLWWVRFVLVTPSNGVDSPWGWFLSSDPQPEKLEETVTEHGIAWANLGLGVCRNSSHSALHLTDLCGLEGACVSETLCTTRLDEIPFKDFLALLCVCGSLTIPASTDSRNPIFLPPSWRGNAGQE